VSGKKTLAEERKKKNATIVACTVKKKGGGGWIQERGKEVITVLGRLKDQEGGEGERYWRGLFGTMEGGKSRRSKRH